MENDYPGKIVNRYIEDIDYTKQKVDPANLRRLHIEMIVPELDNIEANLAKYYKDDEDDKEAQEANAKAIEYCHNLKKEITRVLREYGDVKGVTISRDILVPGEMTLTALHYVMQRLFGFRELTYHMFDIPIERIEELTEASASYYCDLVGVIFQSPCMEGENYYLFDDREDESFEEWVPSKYTAPYNEIDPEEDFLLCRDQINEVESEDFLFGFTEIFNGITVVTRDIESKRIVQLKHFSEATMEEMKSLFRPNEPYKLLQRLKVKDIIRPHKRHLKDEYDENTVYARYYNEVMNKDVIRQCNNIIEGKETKELNPTPPAICEELFYGSYGSNTSMWNFKITASLDCEDLITGHKLVDNQVKKAIEKVISTGRPVVLASDGYCVFDDIKGLPQYMKFLRAVNKDSVGENGEFDREDVLKWAESKGWSTKWVARDKML